MASLNKVLLIGNLTAEVETRYSPSGTAVANFTVACNDQYTDKEGHKQDKTEFVKCVAFGRTGEVCSEYLHKGKQVYVEGKLQTRSWEDKEGVKRYTTEIIADKMQMLGGRGEGTKKEQAHEPPEAMPEIPDSEIPF